MIELGEESGFIPQALDGLTVWLKVTVEHLHRDIQLEAAGAGHRRSMDFSKAPGAEALVEPERSLGLDGVGLHVIGRDLSLVQPTYGDPPRQLAVDSCVSASETGISR